MIATAGFYGRAGANRPLKTLEAFGSFAASAPGAGKIWLARLAGVTSAEVEGIVREVPPNRMSAVTRRFTMELLTVNRQSLLALPTP